MFIDVLNIFVFSYLCSDATVGLIAYLCGCLLMYPLIFVFIHVFVFLNM